MISKRLASSRILPRKGNETRYCMMGMARSQTFQCWQPPAVKGMWDVYSRGFAHGTDDRGFAIRDFNSSILNTQVLVTYPGIFAKALKRHCQCIDIVIIDDLSNTQIILQAAEQAGRLGQEYIQRIVLLDLDHSHDQVMASNAASRKILSEIPCLRMALKLERRGKFRLPPIGMYEIDTSTTIINFLSLPGSSKERI